MCTEGFLNGLLGVSRGIGDYHLDGLKRKPSASKPLEGPMTAGMHPPRQTLPGTSPSPFLVLNMSVTAEPEISMCSLMAEDEFIVLACDGLWDVLPSQRAIELARQYLQQHDNDPQVCAQMLVSPPPSRPPGLSCQACASPLVRFLTCSSLFAGGHLAGAARLGQRDRHGGVPDRGRAAPPRVRPQGQSAALLLAERPGHPQVRAAGGVSHNFAAARAGCARRSFVCHGLDAEWKTNAQE